MQSICYFMNLNRANTLNNMEARKTHFKIDPSDLNARLKWPIEEKKKHFIGRFLSFYCAYRGHVYQSFSGGMDSQTIAELIDMIFSGKWQDEVKFELMCALDEHGMLHEFEIDGKFKAQYAYDRIITNKLWGGAPPKVFCDTGLEFPELRKHAKTFDNVIWLKPEMKFPDVIKNIGVAIGTKKIAMQLRRVKDMLLNRSSKNDNTFKLYTTGIKSDGTKSKSLGLKKWLPFLNAPFKISDKCCDVFKKNPFLKYEKETGRMPIIGTMVNESQQRRASYLQTGCNSFEKGKEACRPISIFTKDDIWELSKRLGLEFCIVYYDRYIKIPNGEGGHFDVFIQGLERTGCMFCLFGIQHDPKDKPNRFQMMAVTHPRQYEFMLHTCGLKLVFDFMNSVGIKIDYKPSEKHFPHLIKMKNK